MFTPFPLLIESVFLFYLPTIDLKLDPTLTALATPNTCALFGVLELHCEVSSQLYLELHSVFLFTTKANFLELHSVVGSLKLFVLEPYSVCTLLKLFVLELNSVVCSLLKLFVHLKLQIIAPA